MSNEAKVPNGVSRNELKTVETDINLEIYCACSLFTLDGNILGINQSNHERYGTKNIQDILEGELGKEYQQMSAKDTKLLTSRRVDKKMNTDKKVANSKATTAKKSVQKIATKTSASKTATQAKQMSKPKTATQNKKVTQNKVAKSKTNREDR